MGGGSLRRLVLCVLAALLGLYLLVDNFLPLDLWLQPIRLGTTAGFVVDDARGSQVLDGTPSGPESGGLSTLTIGPMAEHLTSLPPSPTKPIRVQTPKPLGTTSPARATEPPYIGDKYASEDSPLPTNCSDSIRRRVLQTVFGARFLERVPVLQWQKHATQEEYRRLQQYPGTHGWGGVDFKTLVSSLSVLNTTANRLLLDDWEQRSNGSRCIRCAVVGNGGILRGSRKGQEIDQHDYVFRTNGAVIKGFEEDVGSRTSHYTFSTNTLMNSMRNYAAVGFHGPPVSEETRYVFLPDHDRDYLLAVAAATHTLVNRGQERNKSPLTYFGPNVTVEKIKMYHPDFIRYLRNRFLRSSTLNTRHRNIYRPSTGATMLLAAFQSCDKVSAYGFMTPDYRKYSDHYFDQSHHPVNFFINHDLHMEMVLWQQLHQAGLIHLYMRQPLATPTHAHQLPVVQN